MRENEKTEKISLSSFSQILKFWKRSRERDETIEGEQFWLRSLFCGSSMREPLCDKKGEKSTKMLILLIYFVAALTLPVIRWQKCYSDGSRDSIKTYSLKSKRNYLIKILAIAKETTLRLMVQIPWHITQASGIVHTQKTINQSISHLFIFKNSLHSQTFCTMHYQASTHVILQKKINACYSLSLGESSNCK